MRIEIIAVEAADPARVQFRCEAGTGWATWEGVTLPDVASSHDVEVDHERPLCFDPPLRLVDGSDSRCDLAAVVEGPDENGVVALRIGAGLMLAELSPGERPPPPGTEIAMTGVALRLWPTAI